MARAASLDPQALAASLQSDPVQSIDVPSSSFSALSHGQISSLKAEIARLDPGRIWILVVSPRSQSDLDNVADPVYGDPPAGTHGDDRGTRVEHDRPRPALTARAVVRLLTS